MNSFGQDLKNKTAEAAAIARAEAKAEEMERMVKAANADKHNILLYNECLNAYVNSMRKSLNNIKIYCNQSDLQQLHNNAKSSTLAMVCIILRKFEIHFNIPVISIDIFLIRYIEQFQGRCKDEGQEIMLDSRLVNDIDSKFTQFEYENDRKRREIEVSLFAINIFAYA